MIVVIIVVVAADDHLQDLRDIYAQEAERYRLQLQAAQKGMIEACCPCGWKNHYPTAGRAKMGLSGHQRWCKRTNCDVIASQ
jgi:hypothetical protein